MTTETDNGKISFTVRELLAEIKATLTNIDIKLDQKAEKTVVDNLLIRLATLEVLRTSEQTYGNQLIVEHRDIQKKVEIHENEITALQTNKKDKDTFNLLWIPTIVSFLGIIILALAAWIK